MNRKVEKIVGKARQDESVLAVVVYGSFARRELHRDIDVCVVLRLGEYGELELSQKKLDYVMGALDGVDVQVFQQLPIHVRHRVIAEGDVVYCRDEDALYELVFQQCKEYEDFKPIISGYLQEAAHA